MPYALVPEGYKLQKVTKAQKEAVDKLASTNATTAFLDGPASGELVKAVAIVVTPIVLAVLAKGGIEGLGEKGNEFLGNILETAGVDLSALGEFNI